VFSPHCHSPDTLASSQVMLETQQPVAGWVEGAREEAGAAEAEEDAAAAAVEAALGAAAGSGKAAVDYAYGACVCSRREPALRSA
jgi:hypothetical protein